MFFHPFALLREIGRVTPRRRETHVAFAAVSAARHEDLPPVLEHVADQEPRVRVAHQRPQRNLDIDVFSALAEALVGSAVFAVVRKIFPCKAEGEQIVHVLVAHEIHVAAPAAVAAVGPACGFAFIGLEGIHSVAAVARLDEYFYLIRKFAVCHSFPCVIRQNSVFLTV